MKLINECYERIVYKQFKENEYKPKVERKPINSKEYADKMIENIVKLITPIVDEIETYKAQKEEVERLQKEFDQLRESNNESVNLNGCLEQLSEYQRKEREDLQTAYNLLNEIFIQTTNENDILKRELDDLEIIYEQYRQLDSYFSYGIYFIYILHDQYKKYENVDKNQLKVKNCLLREGWLVRPEISELNIVHLIKLYLHLYNYQLTTSDLKRMIKK